MFNGAFFLDGFSFNLNLGGAILFHIKFFGGCAGQIDDATVGIGSTVINPDFNLLVILKVGHFGLGPNRQTRMSGCHVFLVKSLAAGGLLAMKSRSIPGRFTDFLFNRFAGGTPLFLL
jgi:hypothetical protein